MVSRRVEYFSAIYTGCHKYVPIQTMFNVRNIYFEAAKLSKNMTTAIQQIFHGKSYN
jgi:hypothetical protein